MAVGYEQGLKTLLEMSCTGALVILVVLVARLFLQRGPRLYTYMLWAVVLFRLLCPVSVPSQVSIMNLLPTDRSVAVTPLPEAAVQTQDQAQTQRPSQTQVTTQTPLPTEPVTPAEKGLARWQWAGGIWLTGALALAAGCMIHTLLWKRRLAEAVVLRDNIYLCDWVQTPFVLGIFRPKIYLPSALKEEEMTHIILHEQCHIRRGDHWIRALSLLALCLHWFDPLVWVAFFLSERDMEMSCDEAVLKKLGTGICREYADSLLRLAGRNVVSVGLPLTFGKGGLKMRIKNIVGWKEPKWYVAAACLLLCAVVLVGCGLDAVASHSGADADRVDNLGQQHEEVVTDADLILPETEGVASGADLAAYMDEHTRLHAEAEAASAADLKVDPDFVAENPGVYDPDWMETYRGNDEGSSYYAYGFADKYGNFVYSAPGHNQEESYAIAKAYIKYVEFGGPEKYLGKWDVGRLLKAYIKYYPAMDFEGFLKSYEESGKSLDEFTDDVYSWVNADWLANGQG